jgi:dTDP-4-amino-4,6-dideoxygalactose transaminase
VVKISKTIPLYKPQNALGNEEIAAVSAVLKSGWLTLGPKTVEFESAFAEYIRSKYGIATNSCTSALYLALDSLGIGKGDSVVVPVNTFVATANVVRWRGAEPIFCDIGEDGEIDPVKLANILETNENVKCVIPAHIYGFPCNMKVISRLTMKHGVRMIEDCAQAHGATFGGKKVGSFGDAGCFSFYATKNMTTGEGGMLVTSSKKVQKRALLMRSHCQSKTPREKAAGWQYDVTDLGFNFRMSEIEAAIGLMQLKKLDLITKYRRELAGKYKKALEEIEGIKMLHDPDDNLCHSVFHLLEVKIEKPYPLTRDELFSYLRKRGIITGVHYIPLHYFSYYRGTTKYKKGDFPCAEALFSRILSLPMFPFMTEQEFQTIIGALKEKAL